MAEETKKGPGLEEFDIENVENTLAIAVPVNSDGMAVWSDVKKIDFCKVFENRSKASAYILNKTADILLERTHNLQFIGVRTKEKAQANRGARVFTEHDEHPNYKSGVNNGYPRFTNTVGTRDIQELNQIASDRADAVFRNLPPLKQAVQVIKPEVAVKIDTLEKLKAKLEKLATSMEEKKFKTSIKLSEVEQDMTIGAFRAMVKENIKARNTLVSAINETASEVKELEEQITKDLYAGIPELSDAIASVAVQHYERAKALETMNRRVAEKVRFGDSKAATDLVKGFENDEAKVSDNIKSEFAAALEKLNLSGKQVKKALKGKKS